MPSADKLLVHNVYFSLNDRSPEARQRLIDACRKWLPNHPGIVFFACGALAEDLTREVNVRDWDVGLHIIFKDQAAHDHYQDTEAHHAFIAENKAAWRQVRVFDSVAGQSATP
jgi:hypothetical protein